MVLHQITRPKPAAVQAGPQPAPDGPDGVNTDGPRVDPGRRIAGIVLAALTVPVVVATAIVMQQLGGLAFIAVVVVAIVLGVGSYLLAGASTAASMATPLLIMLIGVGLAFGELFLWVVIVIDDEASQTAKTVAGLAVLAIPVMTTVLLALAGRRRRRRMARS